MKRILVLATLTIAALSPVVPVTADAGGATAMSTCINCA